MTATTEPIVILDGVTRRFATVTAVDELSLAIDPGEAVALLGPNGAGKTTAVEIVLGLTRPDDGRVRLFGGPPGEAVARGRVGAMLQDAGLPTGATVGELVGLIRGLYADPPSLEEVLRLCDLDRVARRQVQRLSGGQQQRVRLAMALAGNPDLLVLDEPTASLDVEARRAFWERTRASVTAGRTLLFATHRLKEADAVADRVIVIARGRLVAEGIPEQVKAHATGTASVRFSADGLARHDVERLPAVTAAKVNRGRFTLSTTDPDRTVRALLQRAPHVDDLEITRTGMEDAYLSLTQKEDA